MEKINTLYEACIESLGLLSNMIDSDSDSIAYGTEVLRFLTNENSKYDNLLSEITYVDLTKNKLLYKRLMMLIITSGSYYFALYNIDNKIEEDYYLGHVNKLEKKDYQDIINEFLNWDDNMHVFDYISDYFEFANNGDLFNNKCQELVLKHDKLDKIMKINPLEVLNFANYVDAKSMLITEKLIQDFIDIYRSSDYIINTDEKGNSIFYKNRFEYLRATINQQIIHKYKGDKEKAKKFYGYIFSNIYENIILYYNLDKKYMSDKYNLLLKTFEAENVDFDLLYKKYVEDIQFFIEVIDFFLVYNDSVYFGELSERRSEFEQKGNVKMLKKLNPYYDVETIYFKKAKNKVKNELDY